MLFNLGYTKPASVPPTPELPYLCFTANTAGSTVALGKSGNPTSVTLETSTDGVNWSTYTINTTIVLSNIGDKLYWRNTSETDTGFSTSATNYYQFVMTGSINGSGDTTTLLNKNGTNTVSTYGFANLFQNCTSLIIPPTLPSITLSDQSYRMMFYGCTSLTSAPQLPATTLGIACYFSMFYNCTSLTTIPSLPATTLADACYQSMFQACTKIKLSTTQTGEYQTAYRIPTTGTGTAGSYSTYYMLNGTGGTFTNDPSINTTYYTSNTVV